jgi:hypothetical protein
MTIPTDIAAIAAIITKDWKNVHYSAHPYLVAMRYLHNLSDMYGAEPAEQVIQYFLMNATTWRGETARAVKSRLKELLLSDQPQPSPR